jgi:putative peptidoglycan lipid II flippase
MTMMQTETSPSGEQLLRRTTTVSVLIGLSVAAGFLVDVLVVALFGIGAETDAFFAAYTVPFILITLLAAVQPVLVSILTGYRQDEIAFSVLLNAAALIALVVAAIGALLARPLVAGTAPGFDPVAAATTTRLARILFLRVPAAAVAEVCRAQLYARRRFGVATFGNAIPSLVTAAVLLILGRSLGIEVVAWGFIAGAAFQATLLFGLLCGPLGVTYHWTLRHSPGGEGENPVSILRQTGRLLPAPLAGLILRQAVILAERILGSYLSAGSVTALSYANRLNSAVAGIFFDGITTASLPSLAERWSQSAKDAFRQEFTNLLKLMATVSLPVGLAIAVLSTPLVRLLFERGQVDRQAAILLATVLGVYSLSLPSLGVFRAVQTGFYALKDTRPIIGLFGGLAALTIGLDLLLVWRLGAVGLALAFAASCGIMMLVGLAWLVRRIDHLEWRQWFGSAWRLGIASAAMAATLLSVSWWLGATMADAGQWGVLATLVGSGLAGLLVFVGLGMVLRLEVILTVLDVIRRA